MTHVFDRIDTRSRQIPRPIFRGFSRLILGGFSAASIASLPPANAREPQTPTPHLPTPHLPTPHFAQLPEAYELSDIQPTDWAYRALQDLINRYGCVSGDIQHLDLGRRPLTRHEYAVALDACFGQLRWELSNAPLTPEELTLLQRLQEDFALELDTFGDRLQTLDDIIEQSFSTTTKLNGEVLFQVGDSFGDDALGGDDDTQAFSGYRARLNLTTSLTGKDILQTRLQSRDIGRLDGGTGTVMSRLATDGESDGEFGIDVSYEFPITDRLRVVTGIGGVSVNDIATVLNPLSSSGRGAVSRFARRDPGTLRGPGGTGVGLRYQPEDWLELNIGYAAGSGDAASPEGGLGLFNGSHSAIVQAVVEPAENLALAVAYARNFAQAGDVDLMGTTGSFNASQPFGDETTIANNWGFQVNWAAGDRFEVGGWFGYTQAYEPGNRDETETILNGAVTFAFPSAIVEDDTLGIIVGIPPIAPDLDSATSLHLEGFYRWQVNESIQITPGLFFITHPNHDEDRSSLWIGTIRTRFSF